MLRKPQKNSILGVVVDAVGTIITPRPSVAEAYAEAARRQGVPVEVSLVKARFAREFAVDESDEHRGPLSTSESNEARRWKRIVHGVLPEVPDPERAFEELWDHFARPLSWSMFEDVPPFLRSIEAAGLKLCIVSNFDSRLRGVLLGFPDLANRLETVTISSEVGYRKPHARIFQAACDRLGLSPGNVLSVGDDLENDVLGARGAGLRAILLDREGRHDGEPACGASLVEIAFRLSQDRAVVHARDDLPDPARA